jgi:hypothetical protein
MNVAPSFPAGFRQALPVGTRHGTDERRLHHQADAARSLMADSKKSFVASGAAAGDTPMGRWSYGGKVG